jgi:hypothetical protein
MPPTLVKIYKTTRRLIQKNVIFMVNSARNSRFLTNGTGMTNSAIKIGHQISDVSDMQYIGGLANNLQFVYPLIFRE